jgi:alanyl-tRNA synthetase
MDSKNIRQKYLDFFKSKGHAIIPSASLIPENDPTTLFTGSGMQPIIPYLMGEKHPQGKRLTDSQKCFRSEDIEEVGNNRHLTFFEMLGNWSLGDYFKKEQLPWFFEFLTQELKLDPQRLYVTVFRGNPEIGVERDLTSVKIWKEIFKSVGIEAKDIDLAEKNGMQDGRIFYYDETKNWWSRSGVPKDMPVGEIGGPDSEVFYDLGADLKLHENSPFKDKPCHINCDCGRFVEIGNNVFIEFIKTEKGFEPLPQKNVDFGGGFERITMVVQGKQSFYETDLFEGSIKKIEELTNRKYKESAEVTKAMRIIAEHLRAATFIMGDDKGIEPSNLDQGYVVRRLIRRAIRYGRRLDIKQELWTKEIAQVVINDYREAYPELERNSSFIISQLDKEEDKFSRTLEKGLRQFNKLGDEITGAAAFNLYQTYGFPIEMTKELAKEKGIQIDEGEFKKEFKKHQELSKTASAGKFKSGLADTSQKTVKLHTAAHLLLAALRKVLGDQVIQRGSNITPERLRFDFSHGEKLTQEQKQEVERLVNQAIKEDLPVSFEEMPLEQAKKQGAMGVFESKYGEKVKVYTIGDPEKPFSREICAGPHVEQTGQLGHFKIIKEQSSSAGVRRIKAVLG